jgi:dihydrofolate reductase
MRILLDMSISPNGYIAREDGDEDWLPEEGWEEFVELAKSLDNIVMGRETYAQVTARYADYNFDNVPVAHKVIITHDETFKAPDGYTVAHSPEEAVKILQTAGIENIFLIGGGVLNSEFMKKGLVNELQLTINPYIIGKGRLFVAPDDYEMALKLTGIQKLSGDRVKLKYLVEKPKN